MFTKKLLTLFAITLFAFIYGVSEINAQALKIGSVVNLQNQYPGENGYLETRGRVKDKSQFSFGSLETLFVSTNTNPNRDNGSGSWRIVSATGKADGSPLLYGDKIHLMNMYPGAGYLDSLGYIKDMPAFASYVSGGSKIGVFTNQSNNRDNGSGTWIVKSASSKADGTSVKQDDNIHLQNGYPNSGYLDINGSVTENPTFKEYTGASSLVFLSEKSNRYKNSGTWKIKAQGDVSNYKIMGNMLQNGQSLRQGEGIRSTGEKYIAILQTDGNFCFNKIDSSAPNRMRFIKCTMTVGSEDEKGAVLTMQEDGNLVLYNSKGKPLWATDTYRGDVLKKGWRLIIDDVGLLGLENMAEAPVWDFEKGRMY